MASRSARVAARAWEHLVRDVRYGGRGCRAAKAPGSMYRRYERPRAVRRFRPGTHHTARHLVRLAGRAPCGAGDLDARGPCARFLWRPGPVAPGSCGGSDLPGRYV